MSAVLVTTTPSVEGRTITDYKGIVTGEAIMGANIFKDLFAGIRDIVGGRSATYERELRRAREMAMDGSQAGRRRAGRQRRSRDRHRLRNGRHERQHADGHRQRHGGCDPVSDEWGVRPAALPR